MQTRSASWRWIKVAVVLVAVYSEKFQLGAQSQKNNDDLGDDDDARRIALPVPSVQPTVRPSAQPSSLPSAQPSARTAGPTQYGDEALTGTSTDCVEWVLGYSGDSCSLTCSRVSRECDVSHLLAITTRQAFDDMVDRTHYMRDQYTALTTQELCGAQVNTISFSDAPGIFSYYVYNKALYSGKGFKEKRYCTYPSSAATTTVATTTSTATNPITTTTTAKTPTPESVACDIKYTQPPVQRFCPCVAVGEVGQCVTTPTAAPTITPPTAAPTGCFVWLLGRAGSTCETTCDSVGGTCNEPEMLAASGQSDLEEILLVAYAQDSAIHPVDDTGYCATISGAQQDFPSIFALNTVFATNPDGVPANNCYWATPTGNEGPPCTTLASAGPFSMNPFCACNVPLCSTWENALGAYGVPSLAPISAE
jgi:hypothetical protein